MDDEEEDQDGRSRRADALSELRMAARMHAFGVRHIELLQETSSSSSESQQQPPTLLVQTWEECRLRIDWSERGYRIKELTGPPDTVAAYGNALFESLDALLTTISPGYRARFRESLVAKLHALPPT